MNGDRIRDEFLIKDLVVRIGSNSGARGGTWMPADDTQTPPTPISPIASVVVNSHVLEMVAATIRDAVKTGDFRGIGLAFQASDPDGDPVIRGAIQEIGAAVVASAAFAALGGEVGLVDPNCGGTSFETIPPTISPVVHRGIEVHRVSELPRLRRQLAMTMEYLDRAAEVNAPRGAEVAAVREQLETALKGLG